MARRILDLIFFLTCMATPLFFSEVASINLAKLWEAACAISYDEVTKLTYDEDQESYLSDMMMVDEIEKPALEKPALEKKQLPTTWRALSLLQEDQVDCPIIQGEETLVFLAHTKKRCESCQEALATHGFPAGIAFCCESCACSY